MNRAAVVIGIPTYRRPLLLARLLDSLAPEIDGQDVLIVVGDNEAGTRAAEVVRDSGLDAVCVPVPRPGISEVRNELVRTATRERPDWRHLIMLDDDGLVTPGWFAHLMAGVDRFGADVTAGPVLGELPAGASLLARNSVYAGRRRHPSGPVAMLNGAQNICVSRAVVDAIGDPWFPVHLGSAGGEDHFFFREVLDQGGTLAWCDEAAVTEPTPASRLATGVILRRAFNSNVVAAQTDRAFHGRAFVVKHVIVGTGWAARNTAAGLVRRDPDKFAATAIDLVALGGRLVGLVRNTPPEAGHAGE